MIFPHGRTKWKSAFFNAFVINVDSVNRRRMIPVELLFTSIPLSSPADVSISSTHHNFFYILYFTIGSPVFCLTLFFSMLNLFTFFYILKSRFPLESRHHQNHFGMRMRIFNSLLRILLISEKSHVGLCFSLPILFFYFRTAVFFYL